MEKLMNVENVWGDCIEHVNVEDPVSMIEVEKAETALKHMASKKASGPTGAVAEMLRTGMGGVLLRASDKDF